MSNVQVADRLCIHIRNKNIKTKPNCLVRAKIKEWSLETYNKARTSMGVFAKKRKKLKFEAFIESVIF